MANPPQHAIEVHADIWCPFTHVGLRAFVEQRLITGRTDLAIRVRPWPLELVNGAPLDAAATRDHVDELREQVAPILFSNFDPGRFPTSTLEALAFVARAYRMDPGAGERASFALRDAIFEEGRDISATVIINDIAAHRGLEMSGESDHPAVVTSWHEGQGRGVLGSPHFFCGSTDAFCPTLEITKGPEHDVSIIRDASRLTEFFEKCFTGPSLE